MAPSAYLLFSNDVTDWFNIGYNVGVEWDGVQAKPNTFLALCLGFNITDRIGAFIESYNYFTDHGKNTDADCDWTVALPSWFMTAYNSIFMAVSMCVTLPPIVMSASA